MERIITETLNVLPRLSYRWLGVNSLQLKDTKLKWKPNHPVRLPENLGEDLILKAPPEPGEPTLWNPQVTGVSRELTQFTEEKANSGWYLEVPEGRRILQPLQLQYLFAGEQDTVLDHNVIIAQPHSELTLVVEYLGGSDAPAWHSGVTKILAQEGAVVNLIKVQRLGAQGIHFDSHYVEVGPYAQVRYVQVELGAKYAVTNYQGRVGANGTAQVDSLYLGSGEQVLDLSYHMIHEGYRSESDILVRGALKERARKTFRGTLDFRRGAALSKGNEEENVLLLDPTVKSDAVPLLLAEEDDVQGGHAASAGRVDEEQLFYLLSRGFSPEEAEVEVVQASFQPVLDLLPPRQLDGVRQELRRRLVHQHA